MSLSEPVLELGERWVAENTVVHMRVGEARAHRGGSRSSTALLRPEATATMPDGGHSPCDAADGDGKGW
jgi:hypothetical protein